jgi:DNA-binding transcriptional ArsR family regulator
VLDRATPSPAIASIAALLGDATRARMLTALMHGRAETATELALDGGVTASTASSHLARLIAAGLLVIEKQGRHRYFRLANADVARAIESLMSIAPVRVDAAERFGPADPGLRLVRVCYDHLAGETAVRFFERLQERKLVVGAGGELSLTAAGEAWFARLGVDLDALRERRRPLVRACLDWSERRHHLAGALGAALLERLLATRLARRKRASRAVDLSPRAVTLLERLEPIRGA